MQFNDDDLEVPFHILQHPLFVAHPFLSRDTYTSSQNIRFLLGTLALLSSMILSLKTIIRPSESSDSS